MAEIILNVDNVAVNLAGRVIFQGISWEVQAGQRVGLVGPNGVGKSTLMKLIAGELPLADGSIFRTPGLTWGRLEQEPTLADGRTTLQEAFTAVPALTAIEEKLAHLEAQMADPAVYNEADRLEKVMAQHGRALDEYERLDGPRYESRVKEALQRVGLDQMHWHTPTHLLSGGQKKLVQLAKLMVQQPTLLLLDEPDNHLDVPAKEHLEKVLNQYAGCVIIISHDRYLLDEVATHIAELENGRLTLYPGNYTAYTTERELRRLRQQQMYQAQQKEIARIEAAIARFELWASIVVDERHIRQARSRQKMLDRMDKVEKVTDARRMTLNLNGWRGSNKVLELANVGMVLPDGRTLWRSLNLTLWHGERVGLVGPNGAGKSMLLRQLLDPESVPQGLIKIGPSNKIGYYAQEQETLNYNNTLLTEIRHTAPLSEGDAVAFLHKFLFTYNQIRGPIRDLSGGERSRLQLAKLVLTRPNLLLLDEPTNNLDIASIEVLEQTLDEFVGAVLVISHDRYFLDKVVDRVVELEDGRLTEYTGGYTDYAAVIRNP
ncbi:MAG TPA: ABC-F family ATP-binding cassette domain-containing protein [Chloroflexota bacterium]|nr:ABC-F family ATP-binding cassette domain-containing protein [Chloroflexota bacterium]